MMNAMKTFALGLIAATGMTVAPRAAVAMNSVEAATRLNRVTEEVKDLTAYLAVGSDLDWDAMKLDQATSRLPGVITSGTNTFNVQRKFNRVSELTLTVRDGMVDLLYETELAEVEHAIYALEDAYIELAIALEEEGVLQ